MYRLNISWTAKLFIEVLPTDKFQSPQRETKITSDFKKTRQRFLCLHLVYHIRNASYASPLTMNLSNLFYIRHSEIDYSFNMMSHVGVTLSLKTVRKRQIETAKARDVDILGHTYGTTSTKPTVQIFLCMVSTYKHCGSHQLRCTSFTSSKTFPK